MTWGFWVKKKLGGLLVSWGSGGIFVAVNYWISQSCLGFWGLRGKGDTCIWGYPLIGYLNTSKKYVGIFDSAKKETKNEIQTLDDIYTFSEQLKATVETYISLNS
jgi:hypothetical protein